MKLSRRSFIKLALAGASTTLLTYYLSKVIGSSLKEKNYYRIYEEKGIAKALNTTKNKVEYQGPDHEIVIQNVLDNFPADEEKRVTLIGDFVVNDTIKIPSYIFFELVGSITLGNNVGKILMTHARSNGDSNIYMSGGLYDANKKGQRSDIYGPGGRNPAVEFKKVTNSSFKDMIVQNAGGDGFVLDTWCNNNTIDKIIGKNCGFPGISDGNGLDDRGDHNIWRDCIAEDNFSDNWVIKCRDSTFINCIGRGSKGAVGFGLFADRNITGNIFVECEAYDNATSGMALNVPDKAEGRSVKIENNNIQGIFYNNKVSGMRLRNLTSDGTCKNNIIDILTYDNDNNGFAIEHDNISDNRGTVVSYDNGEYDIFIRGNSNNFDINIPKNHNSKIDVEKGNKTNINKISCPASTNWPTKKYCQNL